MSAEQMVSYLDPELKLFLVSDYMSMFPHKCLTPDYIGELMRNAKQQYPNINDLCAIEQ